MDVLTSANLEENVLKRDSADSTCPASISERDALMTERNCSISNLYADPSVHHLIWNVRFYSSSFHQSSSDDILLIISSNEDITSLASNIVSTIAISKFLERETNCNITV